MWLKVQCVLGPQFVLQTGLDCLTTAYETADLMNTNKIQHGYQPNSIDNDPRRIINLSRDTNLIMI